ncbi:hypothetical protein AB0F73_02365 [Micromonospora purpureochromogenes]|uniref:hypothetical protein n=1 Tax=Micromonospora purpureochromogenes TaxID=47872 RepID=UPI0034046802
MMTFDAVGLGMDILTAGVSLAAIMLAAVVFVRSRRAETVRLFGRVIHRPGLWASAVVCVGLSGLLLMSSDAMPSSWQKPRSVIYGALWLAFFVLMMTHLISAERAKRRRDS